MAQESCAIILPQFIAVCVIALRQSYIVYEFRFPGSTVKLHYCKAHTQYILNLIIFYWFRNLYTKTSLDALSVPN